MANEQIMTPEKQIIVPISEADTIILPQGNQRPREISRIIHELKNTYFFSPRRSRLKKEFLEQLRDPINAGNAILLQSKVLAALLKYVSSDDAQDIFAMKRTRGESALQFAITRRYELKTIRFLVEECKVPVNPEWILSTENPEIKLYLQQHTALYVAAQKKDVESFKIALKKEKVDLTQYAGISIVDLIQSKIRENQDRNVVVRFFLNRRWNKMLRATTGQIKKQLLAQVKREKSISIELLSLLNQCPLDEIYHALHWYNHDDARLYDKLKKFDLREFPNIYLQMDNVAIDEAPFESVRSSPRKVLSQLPIVPQPASFPPPAIPAAAPPPEKDKAETEAPQASTARRALEF